MYDVLTVSPTESDELDEGEFNGNLQSLVTTLRLRCTSLFAIAYAHLYTHLNLCLSIASMWLTIVGGYRGSAQC